MKHFDAIIIGAGQAGVPLAKKLAAAGKKTALIEKRVVGGTCINDGCTPTKAMIASAKRAFQAKMSKNLGVEVDSVNVNMHTIKTRKDKIVEQFRNSAINGIDETQGLTLYMGEARFTGEKQLTIALTEGGEETLTAEWIFVNTGAQTIIPEIEGLQDISFLTSTSILELEEVPEHLLVIGGNYIGLEFGQMFSRFGAKVTILEQSESIISREDPDIAKAMTDILEQEDIKIITHASAKGFKEARKNEIDVEIDVNKEKKHLKVSHVLIAVGRSPQTQRLNLQSSGIVADEKGYIVVDEKLETNIKGIYALGDVKGGPAFTHIAYNDYTVVYRNLIEQQNYNIKNRHVPYCMFTDPQLARIGLSETEARHQKLEYKIAVLPMSSVARGIETGETLGLMKAIVDPRSKKILGAAILASEGGEVMSVLQMAMEGGITYEQIRYFVFAHPTYTESLNNLFMKIED